MLIIRARRPLIDSKFLLDIQISLQISPKKNILLVQSLIFCLKFFYVSIFHHLNIEVHLYTFLLVLYFNADILAFMF